MITTELIIAGLTFVGGATGIFAFIRAIMDHVANKAAREEDAEERLVSRLERRLETAECRIETLEQQRDNDRQYIAKLSQHLSANGIVVPDR